MAASRNCNAMSLSYFAATYSNLFPLKIKVLSGYSGFLYSISNEEIIEVRRKIHTKGIIAITHHSKNFSIPVNWKLPVSLIHDYRNDIQEALAGYKYSSIQDLMHANPCPSVVCTRKAYNDLLEQNEVLIVKGLSTVNDQIMLNVFSIKDRITKLLPKYCIGEFNTCPALHELQISDIVEHNLLPCKVVTKDKSVESSVIMLMGITTQEMLICSNPIGCDGDIEEFELPTDLPDVKIAVIEKNASTSNSFTTRQGPKNIKSIQASASVFNFSDFTNALPSTAEKLPVRLPFSLSMQRQRKISLSSSLPNMKCLFQSNPSSARLCSSPTIMEPPADDVYLSLHRFVDKYSSNLPATFDVTKQNHSHIRKGKYTVYFITDTEVASVKDDADNVYILQMDDQSQFGIVYSGNEASVFETALDIINHANPPKLICALQPFKGRDAKSSVETNEVLLTTSKTKRHLKVYSITAKMKKNLSASCAGYFTTAPCATKLTIHEIRQYLSEILPVTMEVFPANEIHILAGKKVVTFAHFHAKNTLVASYSTHSHGMQFTSIPLTEPIEVSVTGHSAAEYLCTPRLYDYPFMQHPFNSSSSQSVCDLPLPPPPRMNYSSSTEDSEDDKYVSIESLPPDALSALRNREFLRHLSHIQIIELLDKMGLSHYKENFIRAQVDGERFSTLSQEELRNEFGIEECDLSKILMVTSAKESVQTYLICR